MKKRVEIKIRKGMKIPPRKKHDDIRYVWPFQKMEEGDSILLPEGRSMAHAYGVLKQQMQSGSVKKGARLITRTVRDRQRVWITWKK